MLVELSYLQLNISYETFHDVHNFFDTIQLSITKPVHDTLGPIGSSAKETNNDYGWGHILQGPKSVYKMRFPLNSQ